jgi:hypothetical protein
MARDLKPGDLVNGGPLPVTTGGGGARDRAAICKGMFMLGAPFPAVMKVSTPRAPAPAPVGLDEIGKRLEQVTAKVAALRAELRK